MTVVLYSDKEAAFQNFVGVMDVLKRLGHEQLYIVTDNKSNFMHQISNYVYAR